MVMFLDQIVEYGKGMFPIELSGQPDHRPADDKAEQEVAETTPRVKRKDIGLPASQSPKTLAALSVEMKPIRPPSGKAIRPRVTR